MGPEGEVCDSCASAIEVERLERQNDPDPRFPLKAALAGWVGVGLFWLPVIGMLPLLIGAAASVIAVGSGLRLAFRKGDADTEGAATWGLGGALLGGISLLASPMAFFMLVLWAMEAGWH